MKKHVLYIFLFIGSISFSQEKNIDVEKLNNKVAQIINNHRKSLKIKWLEKDIVLKKAAEDQSCYIAKSKTLSHEQTTKDKKTSMDRVDFYKGDDFILVGENLLYTSVKDTTYSDTNLDVLATKIFTLWKNSPNHYKNIINPKYSFAELGFCLDWNDKRVYVAQVFGAK